MILQTSTYPTNVPNMQAASHSTLQYANYFNALISSRHARRYCSLHLYSVVMNNLICFVQNTLLMPIYGRA